VANKQLWVDILRRTLPLPIKPFVNITFKQNHTSLKHVFEKYNFPTVAHKETVTEPVINSSNYIQEHTDIQALGSIS